MCNGDCGECSLQNHQERDTKDYVAYVGKYGNYEVARLKARAINYQMRELRFPKEEVLQEFREFVETMFPGVDVRFEEQAST